MFSIFFSIMAYYRILNIAPCALQQDFIACFIHTSVCLLISASNLPLPHLFLLVTVSLFFVSVSPLLFCK